ncbi:hypothetical protein B0G80_4692 [Paraburkholderia sp. BL6669N2]|nr:hypothetical protein B0G80_4692 [Paraburkholderia sp. BL6669N2]
MTIQVIECPIAAMKLPIANTRRRPAITGLWGVHLTGNFATAEDGISALSLKRTLEIGSYQTVWPFFIACGLFWFAPIGSVFAGQSRWTKPTSETKNPDFREAVPKGRRS